ncbi:MAG TPA: hypothetical protein VFE78_04795, partial [Gemmataceae bacterium]|nr:hypothetical protein [Gemmataceae bacterium]
MKFARLRHWLRNATRPRRPRPAPRPWRRALWLERLEDRLTPNAVSWTGNANDGNWETGQNWSTGSVPGPNDDVSINTFGTVNHSGADTVNSLTLAGGTLANSGSLTTGALTLDNTFATLNDTGSLTVNGPLNWTGGSLTGAGHTVLNGPSSLAGGFFSMLTDQVVDNHGTATISDGNSIDFRGNAVWNNDSDGTFVLQGSGSLGNFFITSSAAFNNFGTFQKTVGGTSTVGVPFNNSGSVDVQAGTLSPGNGGVGGGTFTVESGATLSVNGYTLNGATVTGAVQVGTFNSLTVAGPSSIENLTINGGTVTANAALSVQDLTLSGGSLTGPAAVRVSGAFNWTGGSLTGTGDTVLDGTSSLTGSFFSALARQVDNYGTATVVAGTSLSFQSNAVFNNQPGATLLLPDSAGMSTFFSGGSALNNAGLLEKTGPAGNSTLGLPVNNTGTIDVQAGTLTLSGGGSNSGSLTAESGTTLSFTGPYTLQGGTVSGPGTFQVSGSASVTVSTPTSLPNLTVSGGSITADAALDVQSLTLSGGTVTANTGAITADSLALSGGTLTGPGTVTVNVAFNWTGGSLNGSGDTVLNGTSTLALANSFFSPLSRQVDNFGTATVAAGDSLTFENNVVFNNEAGATLVLPDSSSLSSFFSGGSALNNAGLVQKTAPAGTSTIGIAFNNTGSVDVQAGTLALTGGGVGGSTFTVEGGATLSTNGYTLNGATVTGDGALQVGIFNSLTVAGPSSIENLTISGGTVTANAALAVQNLTLSGGSLTGPAAVTLSGAFNWTGGGSLTGTGDTVLDGTSTINGSFFAPLERQVDNYGTATVLAGSTLYFENNGVWNNQPTGVFVLPDSAGVSNFFAANPVFNNAGLIQKVAPANTSSFGLTVNNTGTIEVDAGTLSLAGLTNLSGTTLSGGTYLLTGVLQVPSADVHTLAATVVLNGPGSELFNSAFFSQNDAFTNLGANAAGGSLTLENGRALTTPGDFANAGTVAVGAGSAFTAAGNYTQSGGSTA